MISSSSYQCFVDLLGKTWGSAEVDNALAAISDSSEINRSEQLAFWGCPAKGIAIALNDELYVQSEAKQFHRDGSLIIVGIHFYSEGYEGYNA